MPLRGVGDKKRGFSLLTYCFTVLCFRVLLSSFLLLLLTQRMAEHDDHEHRRQCAQRLLIGEPTKRTLPNLFKAPRSPAPSAAHGDERE